MAPVAPMAALLRPRAPVAPMAALLRPGASTDSARDNESAI